MEAVNLLNYQICFCFFTHTVQFFFYKLFVYYQALFADWNVRPLDIVFHNALKWGEENYTIMLSSNLIFFF